MQHFTARSIRSCIRIDFSLAIAIALVYSCAGLQTSRRLPGTVADGKFSPGRPPAANYGPDPTLACPRAGVLPIVASDVASPAKEAGKPVPQADGRLCAAAEALLGWDRKESPDERVVLFVSQYFGLTAPISQVIITSVETEDAKIIAAQLVEPISKFAKSAAQARFGLATQRLHQSSTKLVLLLQDVPLDLDSVPRRLEPNTQATLGGRLVGPYENPKIVIADPTGRLDTPSAPPGKEFRAEVRCGDRPGLIRIEIRGEQQGTEASLASFPIACGTDLPTSVAIAAADQTSGDPAQMEQKLFQLINADRTAAGLPPLAWDDTVARLARAVSERRRDQLKGGAAPSSIDVVDRLKSEGIMSPVVLQNPAQARSAEEAHERFSSSPAHRANFMSTEVTHVGIGVAPIDKTGPAVFTEMFVRERPPLDVDALRAKLRAAIAQKRKDARAPPLATDKTLEEVAQKYADELAANKGSLPKARSDEILAPLRKSYRAINLVTGSKADPLEFAEEPIVAGNDKLLGLGVAKGNHPTMGRDTAYVVLIVTTRR